MQETRTTCCHCGVGCGLVAAARIFGEARAALSLWCQGLNRSTHGTHNGAALIRLHLATGQIGKPGAGPFSLTGQPNAMGVREAGGMANLLSAHRDLSNAADRAELARLWGVDNVPEKPGKTAAALFEAVRRGEIRGLWIACTNPAQSLPDQAQVREALDRCEFVVLLGACRNTETEEFASLLLPAATWGENEGTVTNSERRISHVRRAVPPPGEAPPDWQIGREFSWKLAAALGRSDGPTLFPLFALRAGLRRTCGERPRTAVRGRRFRHAERPARLLTLATALTAAPLRPKFPLHFTSGRLRDQWHGMSRTGKLARLFNHAGEPRLLMHPGGMERRGRILSNCRDAAESEIAEEVTAGADMQSLQERLHCGTSCGSCLAEIKSILSAGRAAA
jgi:assimilatory nitrate reductase catalytic subunit